MMAVGFTVLVHGHQARFQPFAISPEVATQHISYWQNPASMFWLMGRLYYRGDHLNWLLGKVDAADYEACRMNNAALAATLYRTGGLERLLHLEGDFVLVGFDGLKKRLMALRDPLGAYPLFWLNAGDTIILGTSIRPFIDHMSSIELDDEYLADYLAFPTSSMSELPIERSAYRGIQRLLPGWSLEADTLTGKIKCRPYWDWSRRIVKIPVGSIHEAGRLVRERLEAAVRERLSPSGRTACHFSGGMDSTGVALLAERLLGDRGQSVEALTLVFSRDPVLAQEREYFESALERRSALRHHPIPADDFLEWDDHGRIPPLDEPSPMSVDFRSVEALAAVAHQSGADTILAGDGADHLFSHTSALLAAELLRKGRICQAVRLAQEHASATTGSSWAIVQEALQLVVPVRLRNGIGSLLKSGRAPFPTMTHLQVPPWFTPGFARRQRLLARTIDYRAGKSEGHFFNPGDISYLAGDWYNWNITVPRGILQTRPYLDPRLVTLAVGLPEKFNRVIHPRKPVLAAALTGVLPEKIINRRAQAHFNSLLTGYARHQPWLEQLIWQAPIEEGIIDRSVLIDCVSKVALGVFRDARSVGRLRMTLTYLMWLSQRDSWKSQKVSYLPAESLAPVSACRSQA
jgi:asparagine synthase (glutamine-hydrolysing)